MVTHCTHAGDGALAFAARHWAPHSDSEAARALLQALEQQQDHSGEAETSSETSSKPPPDSAPSSIRGTRQVSSVTGRVRHNTAVAGIYISVAETLIELVTEADRAGRAAELVAAYAGSHLKHRNDTTLDAYLSAAASGGSFPAHADLTVVIADAGCGSRQTQHQQGASQCCGRPASTGGEGTNGTAAPQPSSIALVQPSSKQPTLCSSSYLPSSSSGRASDTEMGLGSDHMESGGTDGCTSSPSSSAMLPLTTCPTATPWWWGLAVLLRYRGATNYRDLTWLGPRLADKIIFSLLILSLYHGIGDHFEQVRLVLLMLLLLLVLRGACVAQGSRHLLCIAPCLTLIDFAAVSYITPAAGLIGTTYSRTDDPEAMSYETRCLLRCCCHACHKFTHTHRPTW